MVIGGLLVVAGYVKVNKVFAGAGAFNAGVSGRASAAIMLMCAAAAAQGGRDCPAQVNGAQLARSYNLCGESAGVVKAQGLGRSIPAKHFRGAQVLPIVQVGPAVGVGVCHALV
jgi:hypothetical protein